MFSIPKDVLTDDIKTAQSDVINQFVLMKSLIKTKADKEIIDKSYETFKDKMSIYADAIVGAMRKQERNLDKKEKQPDKPTEDKKDKKKK